jgi:hypothetical protein
VGNVARANLADVNANGRVETAWGRGASGDVLALARSGQTLYVGGKFTSIGGAVRGGIAVNVRTGRVSAWNPDANDSVDALAPSGSTVLEPAASVSTMRHRLIQSRPMSSVSAAGPHTAACPQTQKRDRECCSSDHCNSVVKLLGFDLGENPGGVTLYPMSPEAGSPPCRAVAAAALPFDLTLLGFAYC